MTFALAAIGASTSFGPTWQDARPALSARRTPFYRQRGFIGDDFKPLLTGFARIAPQTRLIERLRVLSMQALDDLFTQPAVRGLSGKLHVALCGPAAPDLIDHDQTLQLLNEIETRVSAATAAQVDSLSLSTDGPVGLLTVLDDLRPALDSGKPLIIVTVDSYNHRARLRKLTDTGALFSSRSPYGLIPGEAAAALLILPVGAQGHTCRFALAQDQIAEDEPGDSDYRAMVRACRDALPADQTIDQLWTNWNNNRFRAAEMSYTQLRLQDLQSPGCAINHPALTFGDLGAAFPGIALAMAHDQSANGLILISGGPGQHLRGAISRLESPE